MSDRIEREIDELLAGLGFDVAEEEKPPDVASPLQRRYRWRVFPGSPVRLMVAGLVVILAAFLLPLPLTRLLWFLGGATLLVAYLTWLFEPDPVPAGTPPDWFARLYRWLYGE